MSLGEVQEGSRGADVRIAQQFFNEAAHRRPGLSADGIYGPLTRDAVLSFQRKHALQADGVIGAATWAALTKPASPRPATAAPDGGSAARAPSMGKPATPPQAASASSGALAPELKALDLAGEPAWLKVALAECGIHERTKLGSQRIIQYHQATTLHAKSDQVAWCSSFVNWCLQQVGIIGTRSAAAASWANWETGLATPKLGCIVQLHHGVKGYTSATGTSSGNHVPFSSGRTRRISLCWVATRATASSSAPSRWGNGR